MARYARLMAEVFSVSLRRELAHRANLLFEVLLTGAGIAAGLGALAVVYSQTDTLAGWTFGEAAALLGTYQIVSGVLSTFIEPNLLWFSSQVTEGQLDEVLLKPVPGVLLASLGRCAPLQLSQVALGGVVLAAGLVASEGAVSVGGVLAWLVLVGAAVAATWGSRVALASLTFWAPHADLDVLYGALWQFGRYPVGIYRQPVRALLTYVVPVALIASVPTRALMRGGGVPLVLGGVAAGAAVVGAALWAWQRGLRRYTSATS